jgi:hypothetical protein
MLTRLPAPRVILCHANEERERVRIRKERQEVYMRAYEILSESQQILREADILLASAKAARISATDEIPSPLLAPRNLKALAADGRLDDPAVASSRRAGNVLTLPRLSPTS